jgi:hypothetical protein
MNSISKTLHFLSKAKKTLFLAPKRSLLASKEASRDAAASETFFQALLQHVHTGTLSTDLL